MVSSNDNNFSTIITEVLDDGTILHIDTNVCDEAADEAIDFLVDKEINETLSFDFTTAMFSMFVKSVHILTEAGWSTEELLQEVCAHSEADDGNFIITPYDGDINDLED